MPKQGNTKLCSRVGDIEFYHSFEKDKTQTWKGWQMKLRRTGRVSDILESEGRRNGLRFKKGSGLRQWKGWVISRQDLLSLIR